MTTPRSRPSYRSGLALTAGTAVFLVLGSGSLGIIGDGGSDRAYLVVLAVLVAGSALVRLRSAGMALVLGATALAQVLVPAVLFFSGAPGTASASRLDVVGLTLMYTALFAVAGLLFRRSAGREQRVLRGATA